MKTAWIMTQNWENLVFLHWPVPKEALLPHLPEELTLEEFGGTAWLGVVSFQVKGTRPRFLPPLPGGTFLELNVRTYVRAGKRSGVYFFSLDANSPPAVKAANLLLPYRHADMGMRIKGDRQRFRSRRTHPEQVPEAMDFAYTVYPGIIEKSALEEWLTERYCLWAKPRGRLLRLDIEHEPWDLQRLDTEIRLNTMASFVPGNWRNNLPLAHYTQMKDVKFYPPVRERL